MKFGKFVGKIPFMKRKKEEETNSEIEAEVGEPDAELSPVEEVGELLEGEELTTPTEVPSSAESIEPSRQTKEKGKSNGEPAAEQTGEPQSERKEGSKAGNLMNELLKEAQSTGGNSPVHLLAKSLDDVDINYLLTEGRTMVVRLKRRTGKIK